MHSDTGNAAVTATAGTCAQPFRSPDLADAKRWAPAGHDGRRHADWGARVSSPLLMWLSVGAVLLFIATIALIAVRLYAIRLGVR